MFNNKLIIVVSISLIALLAGSITNKYFEISKNMEIFASAYKTVNDYYVEDVNPNTLMEKGLTSMLATLDPYTNYISENKIEDFRTQSTGQYAGIGIQVTQMTDKKIVTMVLDGYPGAKNGLKIGDEILSVDGVDVTKMSFEDANNLFKGQVKSTVVLTLKRYGVQQPFPLKFEREKVQINPVPVVTMLNDELGYLKLTDFTMHSGKAVKKGINELIDDHAKGVIIDLRGNPGGLLMEAVNICNIFIPKGMEVVSTKGKLKQNNMTYKTLNSPLDTDIPVFVLVNSRSASASEIVAGTLQDYDRAIIVGNKSFGKGLVQVTRPLSYNSQLKVTTAKYYTPSGRCIQALDYSNRNEDGSVGTIPDSLKSTFRTKNGRVVYDGGGVDPDIAIEPNTEIAIIYHLITENYIFNFATEFSYLNEAPQNIQEFSISDNVYEEFKAWLESHHFEYKSDWTDFVSETIGIAKSEKRSDTVIGELNSIKNTLTDIKSIELDTYQEEIKKVLRDEIIRRYANEAEMLKAKLHEDPYIAKVKALVANKSKSEEILKGAFNQDQ